ncbi:MAG: chemotaxis protein CheW [Oscillospiraceae bacterium]
MDFFKDIEKTDEADLRQTKFLTFWVAGQSFAIEVKNVIEIVGIQEITPIPQFPDYARGIINLRGQIIPVIDARLRFKKISQDYNERTCIIIVEVQKTLTGFIVDEVEEVIDIENSQITQAPSVAGDETSRYISAIAKRSDRVVLVVDFEKVLDDSEFDYVAKMTSILSEEDKANAVVID